MQIASARYARRRATNAAMLTISLGAALFGLLWLVWILATLFINGVGSLSLTLFTESTPAPGSDGGGLLNAIYGSFLMTLIGTVIGTVVGIMAGTYLSEFGKTSRLAEVIRFVNDILLSAPSIVIGLFVYQVLVAGLFGHYSGWAGAVALSIIAIPVVTRTTEDMLRLVPNTLREAASALGSPQWKVVTQVCYRAARNGIITGVLLAIARISGETAPLLYTSFSSQFWSADMGQAIANLPVTIYQMTLNSTDPRSVELAWSGALLITVTILLLNIIARALSSLGGKQG
ncbi:MAG TPA: phosphate ABC transporter permease PstA [Inquilinus sp.]|nr:phosphate ABC transporter permease PstA [Inquilinus sp.]